MKYNVISIINFHSGINWHLDSPVMSADKEDCLTGSYLKIAGWMFSNQHRVARIALYSELLYRSPLMTRIPVPRQDVSSHFSLPDDCHTGFSFDLNILGFGQNAFVYICAVVEEQFNMFAQDAGFFAKNFEVVVCIQIRSEPHISLTDDEAAVRDGPSPLFIASLGRSGTTALMSCLGKSDYVAASKNYPFESSPLTYYINLARLSVTPSSNDGFLAGAGYMDTPYVASTNPFIDAVSYRALYDAFDKSALDMCGAILHAVMERLTSPTFTANAGRVKYISEKLAANTLVSSFSELIWPNTVEIILVRNFSTWLRSAIAFSFSTGNFFGNDLNEIILEERLVREIGAFINYATFRAEKAHIIKYENLIANETEIKRICDTLDIPLSNEMLLEFKSPESQHVTSKMEAPEIFHRIMSSKSVVELHRRFDRAFGY